MIVIKCQTPLFCPLLKRLMLYMFNLWAKVDKSELISIHSEDDSAPGNAIQISPNKISPSTISPNKIISSSSNENAEITSDSHVVNIPMNHNNANAIACPLDQHSISGKKPPILGIIMNQLPAFGKKGYVKIPNSPQKTSQEVTQEIICGDGSSCHPENGLGHGTPSFGETIESPDSPTSPKMNKLWGEKCRPPPIGLRPRKIRPQSTESINHPNNHLNTPYIYMKTTNSTCPGLETVKNWFLAVFDVVNEWCQTVYKRVKQQF